MDGHVSKGDTCPLGDTCHPGDGESFVNLEGQVNIEVVNLERGCLYVFDIEYM